MKTYHYLQHDTDWKSKCKPTEPAKLYKLSYKFHFFCKIKINRTQNSSPGAYTAEESNNRLTASPRCIKQTTVSTTNKISQNHNFGNTIFRGDIIKMMNWNNLPIPTRKFRKIFSKTLTLFKIKLWRIYNSNIMI